MNSIIGVYDFELFPYALGDVLTWNVRTAMRCEELRRECVDIYICTDKRYPAGMYQRGLVNENNFDLFFNELYGAFGTHPRLGNIHIFRCRDELINRLQEAAVDDPVNAEAVDDYLNVLNYRVLDSIPNKIRRTLFTGIRGIRLFREIFNRSLPRKVRTKVKAVCLPNEEVINNYFIKYIHSHENINAFAAMHGGIPYLHPALGCLPDIDEIISSRFCGKKIVSFHLRLRRLDAGYGGEHSYERDSDFLEWFDFLKSASIRYPEVEFIALGRLQEKPLKLLELPNVTSLRVFGLGLGHELTLMLRSDLFIGTSSGFAALANFSSIPYFITKMSPGACHAYSIPYGDEQLPFANEYQKLIYAQETSELLMSLLERGLELGGEQPDSLRLTREIGNQEVDVPGWIIARSAVATADATTRRFYAHEKYRNEETAYLLLPSLERARTALLEGVYEDARKLLSRLEANFPELCGRMVQFKILKDIVTAENLNFDAVRTVLESLDTQVSGFVGVECSLRPVGETGWYPDNWVVEGSEFAPLPESECRGLTFRATSTNAYWHTERFICNRPDGKIVVRLDAKCSAKPSKQRVWIFENGSYRSIGELVVLSEWRTFTINVSTKPASMLELQIDQSDSDQWLSIRNLIVIGGESPRITEGTPTLITMSAWTGTSEVSVGDADGRHNCGRWLVNEGGYVQTPSLPKPGDGGLMISFEACVDQPATAFAPVYLFEGDAYKRAAQYAFCTEWREFRLLIQPDSKVTTKLQFDFPKAINEFSIRNFKVAQVTPA